MAEVAIKGALRNEFGKGASRRIRRDGNVPAVIYGHGEKPTHISLPAREVGVAIKTSNVLLNIDLGEKQELTLPKSIVRNPLKGTLEHMKELINLFAFNKSLVNDDLAKLRYEASIRPGFQEAFSAMFPAPRQRWVDALASDEEKIKGLTHQTLIIHGRDDAIIPLSASLRLHDLIAKSQLHVFGQCGHWTQIEHAARFNQLLLNFFSEANAS